MSVWQLIHQMQNPGVFLPVALCETSMEGIKNMGVKYPSILYSLFPSNNDENHYSHHYENNHYYNLLQLLTNYNSLFSSLFNCLAPKDSKKVPL